MVTWNDLEQLKQSSYSMLFFLSTVTRRRTCSRCSFHPSSVFAAGKSASKRISVGMTFRWNTGRSLCMHSVHECQTWYPDFSSCVRHLRPFILHPVFVL